MCARLHGEEPAAPGRARERRGQHPHRRPRGERARGERLELNLGGAKGPFLRLVGEDARGEGRGAAPVEGAAVAEAVEDAEGRGAREAGVEEDRLVRAAVGGGE